MGLLNMVLEQQDVSTSDISDTQLDTYRTKLKGDLIASMGLDVVSSLLDTKNTEQVRAELEVALRSILNTEDYLVLSETQKTDLVGQVLDEVVGLGPIQPLLDDDLVTEVMVNGCKSLYFEKEGTLYQAPRVFSTPEQIMVVVDRILSPLGRRLDESSPVVSARLENGDRVNAVISPIALDGPVVTIRKFSNRITSLKTLVSLGSMPEWYAQLLSWAVKCRCDIAVAGGTGSGKTTLLNALSCEISHKERIITIEDSAELKFDSHPHVIRLETRDESIEGKGAVTIRDLVKNALRMRPDRIVVGEVRGGEAIDMLQAMNTGHDGSLTTLHAGSEKEAILRLILMSRFAMDLPTDVIEGQIATAIDLIVMSKRTNDGNRFITSCCEVVSNDKGEVVLKPIVTFNIKNRTWELVGVPTFINTSIKEGILSKQEVSRWRASIA